MYYLKEHDIWLEMDRLKRAHNQKYRGDEYAPAFPEMQAAKKVAHQYRGHADQFGMVLIYEHYSRKDGAIQAPLNEFTVRQVWVKYGEAKKAEARETAAKNRVAYQEAKAADLAKIETAICPAEFDEALFEELRTEALNRHRQMTMNNTMGGYHHFNKQVAAIQKGLEEPTRAQHLIQQFGWYGHVRHHWPILWRVLHPLYEANRTAEEKAAAETVAEEIRKLKEQAMAYAKDDPNDDAYIEEEWPAEDG